MKSRAPPSNETQNALSPNIKKKWLWRGDRIWGSDHFFFVGGFGRKKSQLIHTSSFFYVYMSECRQFKGLSTGMSILTIPNHTIKLQLHRRGTPSFLEEKK